MEKKMQPLVLEFSAISEAQKLKPSIMGQNIILNFVLCSKRERKYEKSSQNWRQFSAVSAGSRN